MVRPRALRPSRPPTARLELELAPAGPIDIKPDPWQRLVAIGSILSVLVVSVGLYLTNRATLEGQITDRFTEAIGQLGQDKVDVRLGAIYALERIMRDSAADQPAVVEVLAAFVRVHPTQQRPTPTPTPAATRSATASAQPSARPSVDVQAALTVLGRRDTDHDGHGNRLDLTHTNLAGANLTGANLIDTNLTGANLTGANLTRVNLALADLTGANLIDANLNNANLTRANLTNANLTNANLTNAYLTGANLTDVNLTYANLTDANLTNTGVTSKDVRCAWVDGRTMLPERVARPAPLIPPSEREGC